MDTSTLARRLARRRISPEAEGSRDREHQRQGKRHCAAGAGRDRLSDLPDCLLHAILSRLKARQTVQTCVLSRRWRHLWRSVPCLDIDVREFLPGPPPKGSHNPASKEDMEVAEEEEDVLDKFEDFADGLLAHRDASSLDTLRFCAISPRWPRCTHRFLRRGVEYSPVVLDVLGKFMWARCMSSSSSTAGTRRLKKLRLDHVFLNHRFEEQLSSGLPVLEELELRNVMFFKGLKRLVSGTLRKLFVENCTMLDAVDIVAARLTSLRMLVGFRGEYGSRRTIFLGIGDGGLPSLVSASIGVLQDERADDYGDDAFQKWLRCVCKFIHPFVSTVASLETLELSGLKLVCTERRRELPAPFVEFRETFVTVPMLRLILDEQHKESMVLRSLRTLILDGCEIHVNNNLETLWQFLRNAPTLEKLTLRYQKLEPISCKKKFSRGSNMSDRKVISSIPDNLKLIEIQHGNEVDDKRLRKILSEISRELPKTTVQVTKVDFVSMSSLQRCLSNWEGWRKP